MVAVLPSVTLKRDARHFHIKKLKTKRWNEIKELREKEA